MALSTIDAVIIELYDNPLTDRIDDRYGRVVNIASVDEATLITRAIDNGFNGNSDSMKATLEAVGREALKAIVRGELVHYGLGHIALDVDGPFIGDAPVWNPDENRLVARISPTKALRETLKSTPVRILGMAPDSSVITQVSDVTTGKVNAVLTPGGMAHIRGHRIKIAGDKPGLGLFLHNEDTQEQFEVPTTSIGINDPSKISFVAPPLLTSGNYQLRIVTQYTGSNKFLHDPRELTLPYLLAV